MRTFTNIVEQNKEPSTNVLWLYNGILRYFGPKGWTIVGKGSKINWEDIENKPDIPKIPGVVSDKENGLMSPTLLKRLNALNTSTTMQPLASGAELTQVIATVNSIIAVLKSTNIIK